MLLSSPAIVVLTVRREQIDIVSGLESGADDYLTKPFSVVELLAPVRPHLHRSGSEGSGNEKGYGATVARTDQARAINEIEPSVCTGIRARILSRRRILADSSSDIA